MSILEDTEGQLSMQECRVSSPQPCPLLAPNMSKQSRDQSTLQHAESKGHETPGIWATLPWPSELNIGTASRAPAILLQTEVLGLLMPSRVSGAHSPKDFMHNVALRETIFTYFLFSIVLNYTAVVLIMGVTLPLGLMISSATTPIKVPMEKTMQQRVQYCPQCQPSIKSFRNMSPVG